MDFLDLNDAALLAWDSVSWEDDPWARGGYAYFHPDFNPADPGMAGATLPPRLLRRRTHQPEVAGIHERSGGVRVQGGGGSRLQLGN